MLRFVGKAAFAAGLASAAVAGAAFEECEAPDAGDLTVGAAACRRVESAAVGGTTAFTYFVPPGCSSDALPPGAGCPVLFLLHGFGGEYDDLLWTGDASRAWPDSPWIAALTSGPPVDPNQVADPWRHADPAGWIPLDPIDLVLVAPHGRTVPGGFGPAPDLDSFWTDWNPRYGSEGDEPQYATPSPRFESMLVDELVPYVEARFPVRPGRASRAVTGRSLGGYGAFVNALRRPDVWSSAGSISGAHNFLFAPAPNPIHGVESVGGAGGDVEPVRAPGIAPSIPITTYPAPLRGFLSAFFALGDPVTDQAWYRGHMPRDLAMNARASAGGVPSIHFRYFHGDAVPRRPEELGPSAAGDVGFEALVLPMNVAMEEAFESQGVEREYELHPGLHSWEYSNAWLRSLLRAQADRLTGKNGAGSPPPAPARFDYRAVDASFSIWGWSFAVERDTVELLNLRDVSCEGLTLQGTGRVTIGVPAACGTGLDGSATFEVDLGPGLPVDEPAGASGTPLWGNTRVVSLEPLS